jgi:hypothetical protein
MSYSDTISNLVALVAIFIAAVSLIRQSKQSGRMKSLEEAQLRQQRATALLHEKQLELLVANDPKPASAHVKLELYKAASGYRFRVTNLGPAAARNVSVRMNDESAEHNPIMEQDYNARFPAPIMEPDSSIEFLANIYIDSPSAFNAIVTWTDPDGVKIDNTAYVTI